MKKTRHIQDRFQDARAQRVIGFLAAKKLLITDQFKLWPNTKLRLDDALWVGRNVEPRVLEVLPAALIHFPRTFIGKDNMPNELENVIEAIKRDEPEGPDFEGMRYQAMKRWANRQLPDNRTKPIRDRKRNKTFRLRPEVISKLRYMADQKNINETTLLEQLILGSQGSSANKIQSAKSPNDLDKSENDKVVFVLGAGFNRDVSTETGAIELNSIHGQSTENIKYPLLTDAWQICFPSSAPNTMVSIEEQIATAIKNGDEQPFFRLCEDIMRCDYYLPRELIAHKNKEQNTIYHRFLEAFPKAHYLSFNFDSLLEIILLQLGRWNPIDGYGVAVDANVFQISGKAEPPSNSQNLVVHLHGSLCLYESNVNWDTSGDLPLLQLRETAVFKWDPNSIAERFPGCSKATFQLGDDISRVGQRVIAPVPDKSSGLKGQFIKAMYEIAEQIIERSRRVIAIGYDFNTNDRSSYEPLIEKLCTTKSCVLLVIAPNADDICRRLHHQYPALQNRISHKKLTFRQWAEHGFKF